MLVIIQRPIEDLVPGRMKTRGHVFVDSCTVAAPCS
jgi:hypothetical protein